MNIDHKDLQMILYDFIAELSVDDNEKYSIKLYENSIKNIFLKDSIEMNFKYNFYSKKINVVKKGKKIHYKMKTVVNDEKSRKEVEKIIEEKLKKVANKWLYSKRYKGEYENV